MALDKMMAQAEGAAPANQYQGAGGSKSSVVPAAGSKSSSGGGFDNPRRLRRLEDQLDRMEQQNQQILSVLQQGFLRGPRSPSQMLGEGGGGHGAHHPHALRDGHHQHALPAGSPGSIGASTEGGQAEGLQAAAIGRRISASQALGGINGSPPTHGPGHGGHGGPGSPSHMMSSVTPGQYHHEGRHNAVNGDSNTDMDDTPRDVGVDIELAERR
jgi:hypothetical protein